MLSDAIKQEIRDRLDAITKAMPGFRSRPAQRLMIAEVAKTLANCPDAGTKSANTDPGATCCLINGGTGTGKSLAYSVAGMVMAKSKKKRLVISSSTIALQEQLVQRDLPFFQKASGLEGSIELAKGRTRFVCLYKLGQAISDMQQISFFPKEGATEDRPDSEAIRKDLRSMAEDFAAGSWNGDRDLRPTVSDDVWKAVTTDRHGCINRSCPSFKQCAQMAARKRVKEASVIVVNHDLLLADLAMGGGKILPPPEECFFVIDEAHHLPEKAVSTFASSHFVNAERRSTDKLANFSISLTDALGRARATHCEQIHDEAMRLKEALAEVSGYLGSLAQLKPSKEVPRPTLEFAQSCLPEEFHDIGSNIVALSNSLLGLLDECQQWLNEMLGTDRGKQALVEKMLAEVGFYLGRLETLHDTWALFLQEPVTDSAPPVAKWVETVTFKNTFDFQLNASPVVAAGYLREMLWKKAAGVVLASATMTTMGNFTDFLKRSGLSEYDVKTVELPSPFDYATQGSLHIPKMPNPKDYEKHTAALTQRLIEDIGMQKAEGLLALFTSRRQMEDVAGRLPLEIRERVLVQGEQPKSALLSEHCRRIDSGLSSAVFGLNVMTEGVDLPGKYCSKVVITKLPFSVPDSPVLRALSGWIERRGGNPFIEISVSDAARKLEQSVGRLIRTETDVGEVVVTDPRLWESRYGRSILKGLPPFRIVAMGKEVQL